MEWYDDSIACLEVSKMLLIQLEEQQEAAIFDKNVIPYLKVTIKNILENCRSPLDYAANYINLQYPAYNSQAKRLQFPILFKANNADYNIKKALKCVPDKEILQIIKTCQINKNWLLTLTSLVNSNKHNNLSHQDMQNTSKIKSLSIGGITFTDSTFSGNKVDISYNGKEYTGAEILNLQPNMEGEFTRKYFFKDTDQEVYPTLESIVKEVEKVITKLHNELSK